LSTRLTVAWLNVTWLSIAWLHAWLRVLLLLRGVHSGLRLRGLICVLDLLDLDLCDLSVGSGIVAESQALLVVLLHHGVEVESECTENRDREKILRNRNSPVHAAIVGAIVRTLHLTDFDCKCFSLRLHVDVGAKRSNQAENDAKVKVGLRKMVPVFGAVVAPGHLKECHEGREQCDDVDKACEPDTG
jgi:hypothetical protein